MCGIFAVYNDEKKQAAQTTLEGLKKLEYRGYDSWGIAIKPVSGKKIKIEKHIGKIGEASTGLPDSSMAIGHTRWATHGKVTDSNAHPHIDCSGSIAVIHNGIVENYQEIKEKLTEKHRFRSETDTEVIAHLIEEYKKKLRFQEAVFKAFADLIGSNAIVVMDFDSESIISCRNGSPIAVGIDKKNSRFYLGSDVTAFLKHTNRVCFLADGQAVQIEKNRVRLFDLSKKKEIPLVTETLDWKLEDAQKEGFPHFMLKEIHEQKKIAEKIVTLSNLNIDKLASIIKKNYRIVLTGCGTASYCALMAKYFFAENKIDADFYGAYEIKPFLPFINNQTILIAVSQSGETADTLLAVKAAKAKGAVIASFVNARGSTMERLSDIVVPVSAGPEIAVVSTKAFTAQLINLYLLAETVVNRKNEALAHIEDFSVKLKKWLNRNLENKIIELSKSLIDMEHSYVIGKNLNYGAALEFALKLKESSYVHAEAFTSGELKHGVITLIQKETPCFVLLDNDEQKQEVLSSAAEIKARGGKIIALAPFESDEFDLRIETFDAGKLSALVNIIAGQLIGYFLGVGRGNDPDKPRNLAKSVTVK